MGVERLVVDTVGERTLAAAASERPLELAEAAGARSPVIAGATYPVAAGMERARGLAAQSTLDVGSVNWIWIPLVAAVFVAGMVGVASVRAAAEADRVREAGRGVDSYELHLLATMAGVARADLNAGTVEIVLLQPGRFGRDGVVVTGSALARGRAGARVVLGEGLPGRVLGTGRTALDGRGEAMAAAIGAPPVGVVVAMVALDGPRFGPKEVARLERLAAEAGEKLGVAVSEPA